jgi:hypothetical protein
MTWINGWYLLSTTDNYFKKIALDFVRSPRFILDVYLFTIAFFEMIFLNIYGTPNAVAKRLLRG